MFPYVSMAEKRIEGIGSGGLTKDRPRTGHSRKIVPGLEALTNGWSIKPGPERSEGPAFNALPRCYPRTRNLVRVHQKELFFCSLCTAHSSLPYRGS